MKNRILFMCLAGAMILTNTGCGVTGGTTETSLVSYEEAADMLQDRLRSGLDGESENAQKKYESEEADMKEHESAAPAVSVPEISMEKRTLNEGADTSAVDFAEKLKVGWNLGNTFDAGSDQNMQDEMAFESMWCGVKTTKEMIDALQSHSKFSVVITLILAFAFLHEEFTAKSLIGCVLIGAGTLVMVL